MSTSNRQAAAKVTRVKRRDSSAEGRSSNSNSAADLAQASSTGVTQEERPSAPSIVDLGAKTILGEIQERSPPSFTPMTVPSSGAEGFPKATHRKQSSFLLSRRTESTKRDDLNVLSQRAPPPNESIEKHLKPRDALDATMSDHQLSGLTEKERIDAENAKLISSMTEEQIRDALSDVVTRLSPRLVSFLRGRGSRKVENGGSFPSADVEGDNGDPEDGVGIEQNPPRNHQQPSSVLNAEATCQAKISESNEDRFAKRPPTSLASRGEFTEALTSETLQNRSVARIRFSITGELSGGFGDDITSAEGLTCLASEQPVARVLRNVVTRDPLRQAEGSVSSDGYTLIEACLLARSSMPQQRVLALRLLGSVLSMIHPQYAIVEKSSNRESLNEFESEGRAGGCGGGGGGDNGRSSFRECELRNSETHLTHAMKMDLWHHALRDANIAVVLRYALDDTNPHVVTAAAEALASLLGLGTYHHSLEASMSSVISEVTEAIPFLGRPKLPHRHMQRLTASQCWLTSPLDLQEARARAAGAMDETRDKGEDSIDDDIDEKALAKVDPLGGLMNMNLFERIVHIIEGSWAPKAVAPALKCLFAACCAGGDVVERAARTPGLLKSLAELMSGVPQEMHASLEAQGWIVQIIYRMCLSSSDIIEVMNRHTLFDRVSRLLLFHLHSLQQEIGDDTLEATVYIEKSGFVIEALRIWAILGLEGFYFLSVDETYPVLCDFLSLPSDGDDGSLVPHHPFEARRWVRWAIGRELFILLKCLLLSKERGMALEHANVLSDECVGSISRQMLTWLEGLPVSTLFPLVSMHSSAITSTHLHSGKERGMEETGNEKKRREEISGFLSSSYRSMQVVPVLAGTERNSTGVIQLLSVIAGIDFLRTYYKHRFSFDDKKNETLEASSSNFVLHSIKNSLRSMALLPRDARDVAGAPRSRAEDSAVLGPFLRDLAATCLRSNLTFLASVQTSRLAADVESFVQHQSACISAIAVLVVLIGVEEVVLTQTEGTWENSTKRVFYDVCQCHLRDIISLLSQRPSESEASLTVIEPWGADRLQFLLSVVRGLTVALEGYACHTSQSREDEKGALGSTEANSRHMIVCAWHTLQALPPGADDLALRILSLMFERSTMEDLIRTSRKVVEYHRQMLAPLTDIGTSDASFVAYNTFDVSNSNGKASLARAAFMWLGYQIDEEASKLEDSSHKEVTTSLYPSSTKYGLLNPSGRIASL